MIYLIPTLYASLLLFPHLMVLYFCFSWTIHHKHTWKRKKEHVAIRRVAVPPCSSLSAPRTVQTFKCGEVVRPVGDFGWQISNPNTFAFHSRILGFLLAFSYFCIYIQNKLSQNNETFQGFLSIGHQLIWVKTFHRTCLNYISCGSCFWAKNTSKWVLSLMVWLHLITTYISFLCAIVLFLWL